MAIDVVYISKHLSVDWSGPPPTFGGVGKTVGEALEMAISDRDPERRKRLVQDWIDEKDLEIRAYFAVVAYDMTTTPPTKMDRPDLERGGGPVKDA
jgi:hypothetical protein